MRAQEAATELNVNTRFGRMELAAEKVAPDQREAFLMRRKAWGNSVRVADYEMAGLSMKKGEADADVLVKVAWYRVDQGDLHITVLKQKWHDFKGDWKLVDESRADGAIGLMGEPTPAPTPAANGSTGGGAGDQPAPKKHFPTIRLGSGDVGGSSPSSSEQPADGTSSN